MKVTKYRCLACLDAFDSLEEAEYHAEHMDDTEHEGFRTKFGSHQMIQMLEIDDLQEVQQTLEEGSSKEENIEVYPDLRPRPREWTDYPKGIRIGPYVTPYPYPPYYRYGYGDKRGKYRYLCLQCNFESTDPKEFMKHLTEIPSHKEDLQDWLKNHLKGQILHRIRVEKGSTMRLSDEDLDRYAETELKEIMFGLELTTPQPERMTGVISHEFEVVSQFLQGKTHVCPICNLESLSVYPQEEYRTKIILEGLKSGMHNLTGKETGIQLMNRKYQGYWNDDPIDLCLRCNIHLHLRHPATYKSLYASKTLKGGLVSWLATESYMDKKPFKEELAKGLTVGKDVNLSKGEKKYLSYFSNRK